MSRAYFLLHENNDSSSAQVPMIPKEEKSLSEKIKTAGKTVALGG